VLGVSGVAQDAIISIRAGASRRQAPVSACGKSGMSFKFAGGPAGVNPFKIDVLQPVGSTRLALKPGGGTFVIPLKGAEGITVNLAVREAKVKGGGQGGEFGEDLFDRIDADKDGVISRREFNEALRIDGNKPVLQPLDDGNAIPVKSWKGKDRLPPLPKDEDGRFPAAAVAAKEYLESHNLLPFVRALLQTVVRDRPDDPFNFIADQFRDASTQPCKPPRPTEDLNKKTAEIPDVVESALQTQGVKIGVDFDKLGPQEKQEAIYKAQEALGSVLREAAFGPDVGAAKEKARQALTAALFSDDLTDGEMMEAKDKARDSLMRSLTNDVDDEAVKARARDALSAALFDGDEEELPDIEGAKQKARSALTAALMAEDAPLEDASEIENAKAKARMALNAALMNDPDHVEDAKAKAREALALAMMEDDDDVDAEESAKAKARDALANSLLGGDDEEEAKANAREALTAVLLSSNTSGDDVDMAKGRACDAFFAMLDSEEEEAKAKARDALQAALFADDDGDVEEGDVEQAKAVARDALAAALLRDDSAGAAEEAKVKAREALSAALFGDDEDDELQGKASLETTLVVGSGVAQSSAAHVELAKQSAREALAQALLAEAAGSQVGSGGDPLEEQKKHLTATKDEMGKMNNALKEEISELNVFLDDLSKQHDALRMKLNAAA